MAFDRPPTSKYTRVKFALLQFPIFPLALSCLLLRSIVHSHSHWLSAIIAQLSEPRAGHKATTDRLFKYISEKENSDRHTHMPILQVMLAVQSREKNASPCHVSATLQIHKPGQRRLV